MKKSRTAAKRAREQRGTITLSQPIEPSTLHAIMVVGAVALGGIVVVAVALAAARAH